jgi:iron-sulfur cluster assembly accessory protein
MNALNLTITPAADKFVRRVLRFDGGLDSGLRLEVVRDSSGLSAQFDVADAPLAGETVLEQNGLRFFLPAESRLLLQGVTMDFQETAAMSGFKFYEPSQVSTCGTKSHNAPSLPEHVHEH